MLRTLRRWGRLVPFGFARRTVLRLLFRSASFRRKGAGTFQVSAVPVDWGFTSSFATAGVLFKPVSDWQLRLRILKEAASSDPQMQRESKDFYFSLDNAIDAVNSLAENARDTLSEQNEAHAKKKK